MSRLAPALTPGPHARSMPMFDVTPVSCAWMPAPWLAIEVVDMAMVSRFRLTPHVNPWL